ncbi:MAG: phosphate acyltransferase PlsX [Candidatus Marinimicrobia bacterium]|nr:phosphate acyltransferase PlsX [Candidatus Neomarinimicrobiota bacterium]
MWYKKKSNEEYIRVNGAIVAVDAMGGDYAPGEIVRGAADATLRSDVNIILVGDEKKIKEILDECEYKKNRIDIIHTDQRITNEETPRLGILRNPKASMLIAASITNEGKADSLVSAGNTGAYVLSCAKHISRIPGVKKTAIATVFPTQNAQARPEPFSLLLDVGANVHCNPEDLVQFAIMGKIYFGELKGLKDPTIALLNIGKEEYKGGDILSRTYKILASLDGLNFIGNIEGHEILKGYADIVVTEGYVGNIVMKTIEGMADILSHFGRYAFKRKFIWKLGLIALSSGLKQIKQAVDYSEYGGAPILGFKKIIIKAHGRSKAKAVTNAILVAARSHMKHIPEKIKDEISSYNKLTEQIKE